MDKPRLLSEPEAWRLIAERLATTHLQAFGFLCCEVDYLRRCNTVSESTWVAMATRLKRHLGSRAVAFVFRDGGPSEQREYRVLAALWLALEAEDESAARRVASLAGSQ